MADSVSSPPKPVHTIVLDAGPILKNTPPLSTLLNQCEELITTRSVVSEIRDPDARQRVETMYLPFLKQRSPKPESFNIISEFARKTGDRSVLSRTDIEVLALAYEIECERNGGDWRLRSVPGQKRVNGKPPVKEEEKKDEGEAQTDGTEAIIEGVQEATISDNAEKPKGEESGASEETAPVTEDVADTVIEEDTLEQDEEEGEDDAGDSDGGEWITPSNYKKKLAHDDAGVASTPEPKIMQVATMTTDFACQNVLLQMNLNLLSTTTLQRIQHLKSFIKRCHACFLTTKDMNKQFCPRCGKDTLTRVSCSTTANGQFTMHLKKNIQWNNRGNRYSVPKPIHGSSNGKWKGGGGKGGWGTELILSEDQKEYQRSTTEEERRQRRERDLMDEDYLPGILTGERNKLGGRIKVGAGRNVNSKKR
ncbi:20S-pre-rRNA D-site endonuclease nob1 [Penicillium angulare]|uniref:20S-pre-rRNA D-site endonuclease nob1 n=1 Tax=Penicillium angulare TaxID=116970 RepID=UPI002541A221|nr:20S-pre-rRNA D-site endonuclease nob1 [Penicillium angulare]KAJ5280234.1 20S-pre-rRNA D-site endonuclease nob1 [Penicillium angulare]